MALTEEFREDGTQFVEAYALCREQQGVQKCRKFTLPPEMFLSGSTKPTMEQVHTFTKGYGWAPSDLYALSPNDGLSPNDL